MIATERRYDCLDGLRGLAALMIAAMHVSEYFQTPWGPARGYLAVDFFFMLSGFVIAHAYDRRLQAGLTVTDFVKIRVARLYPLIILGVALGGLAWVARARLVGDVPMPNLLAATAMNALLLPTPALLGVRPWAFPINSPLWSLSVEMFVNSVYAVAFRVLTIRRLMVCAAMAISALAAIAWRFGNLNVGFAWADFPAGLSRVFYPFCVGMILLRIGPGRIGLSPWGHAAGLGLVIVLAVPFGPAAVTDLVSVAVVFPLIIAIAARAAPVPALDAIWRRLGRLSYPLYMTHFPCVVVFSNMAHLRGLTGIRLEAASLLCFVAVVALAGAAEVFFDIPARAALKRLLLRGRRPLRETQAQGPGQSADMRQTRSSVAPVETR